MRGGAAAKAGIPIALASALLSIAWLPLFPTISFKPEQRTGDRRARAEGRNAAAYGEEVLERLGADLSTRFGRGFSPVNLGTMRLFYLAYATEISQTLSEKSGTEISQTPSENSELASLAARFPLPWSAYALLVRRARSPLARSWRWELAPGS